MSKPFLLEVGMEEMPARFVPDAMTQLEEAAAEWLKSRRLTYERVQSYATPRRLALLIDGLAEMQEDVVEEARGPAEKIALDDNGEWTKAALGFARGQGVAPEQLEIKDTDAGRYVFASIERKGRPAAELLPEMKTVITSLSFPKNMRWGHYSLRFVRPIHWIVALYGSEVIPFEITDVATNRVTYGHRPLGGRRELEEASKYREELLSEHVIVDPVERKEAIRKQLVMIEQEQGWKIPADEALLDEVTHLVEYPTALYGSFTESFLEIPEEVLITSMKEHQRYFPVQDENDKLLPYFITVRNGDHEHLDNVRKGNEKVLHARLADAAFFYREDLKLAPDEAVKQLDSIVHHENIGTMGDKVRRTKKLTERFNNLLEVEEPTAEEAVRTAEIAKFDLVTLMVDEFSELQGLMGEKYALEAGETPAVASAINEHYSPRHSDDTPAESTPGAIVACADKLDTIVTSFAIGLIPTGSQDPYALRRQAAGVVQTVMTHRWPQALEVMIDEAVQVVLQEGLQTENEQKLKEELLDFFRLRLKNELTEAGIRYDIIDAVLAHAPGRLDVLLEKAELLQAKTLDAAFKREVEAFSRVNNIAKKAEGLTGEVQPEHFEKEEEKALYNAYHELEELPQLLSDHHTKQAYEQLANLAPVIDQYFEEVMVMAEEEAVRHNRLLQMKHLAAMIYAFADFQAVVFASE
ncbi:glycyl-tRNA synthetase beta chain [Salsuginibacillus halophilus]|uniref:Glycine--tRNA ligase beta subunit n=1 Tax=Salsuginibacillus halophilus TaxID=517424 RepID=A0A2P8HFP5_9BACI|nr:glycine--tRNA ligase subunit beta [Salsuginibacillus halophilus]PSL45014.1 glycyl-tRNA synthetase beta chain [Salsuginibacillus halophilus]